MKIKKIVEWTFNVQTLRKIKKTSKNKKLFLMMTPQYVNYGDHAIAEAELCFLKDKFPSLDIIEISYNVLEYWFELIQTSIQENDVIAITGGGFMGDLWPELQKMVIQIMKTFRKNPIIFFPQTVWFSKQEELYLQTKEAFSNHPNIKIFLRDQQSFDFVVENLMSKRTEHCMLASDMVLYLRKQYKKYRRSKAALCIRKDKEGILTKEKKVDCVEYLKSVGVRCSSISMAINHMEFPIWARSFFLSRKFKEYSKCCIVITDRLHGMLFAAITGTPCLAFDNINKKVSGVYCWVKDSSMVKLYNERQSLSEQIEKLMLQKKQIEYNEQIFESIYLKLKEDLE